MTEQEKQDDNVVYIGQKPFMNYVTSVVVQFTTQNKSEVTIKARGKLINRAVDVAEVVKRRFMKEQEVEVKDIQVGSEELESKDGKKVNVSTIEIVLAKK